MLNDPAGLGIGNSQINGLPNIDFVREVIPVRISRQLLD